MKIVCGIIILLCCVGCVTFEYEDPSGRKVSYTRYGKQSINGLSVSTNTDGTLNMSMQKQSGDSGDGMTVIKNLTEIIKEGIK